jgi:GDP-L-fucose synthase
MARRVLLTGGTGFLGKHVTEAFRQAGWEAVPLGTKDGDLRDPANVRALLGCYWPDAVVHLAASCGGIGANQKRPADYFYSNALMGLNVVHECSRLPHVRLVVAGSICGFPHTPPRIPFVEDDLHAGYPEPTNAPYGVVKRDLAVMLEAYRQQYGLDGCMLMPTNLWGEHDNFDLDTSHVIPALIRKVLAAKESGQSRVEVWGTGKPTRDFLHAKDAARAFVIAAGKKGLAGPYNLGSGLEVPIWYVAELVADLCGWKGDFVWNESKPDGQPRRVLDSSKAAKDLGWKAEVCLRDGLAGVISWWKANRAA